MPTLVVLLVAVGTRSTLPALAGGILVGHLLLDGSDCVGQFARSLNDRLATPTVAWVVLVCGLLGGLTHLLVRAGGTAALARLVAGKVRTGRAGLLVAWLAGLAIFIDDYLNVLLVGGSLRPVTDELRVPRERLAYVIDATAAPVCLLVPLSTWAVYVAGLLEAAGAADPGGGLATYTRLVPWIFYGWAAIALVPLFAGGWLPSWGAMRAADDRLASGGDVAPPGSPAGPEACELPLPDGRLSDFLLPVGGLVAGTVLSASDALPGVLWSLLTAAVWQVLVRRRMTVEDLAETACRGIGSMTPALATIVLAFMLQDINTRLGLTQFVIEAVAPHNRRGSAGRYVRRGGRDYVRLGLLLGNLRGRVADRDPVGPGGGGRPAPDGGRRGLGRRIRLPCLFFRRLHRIGIPSGGVQQSRPCTQPASLRPAGSRHHDRGLPRGGDGDVRPPLQSESV